MTGARRPLGRNQRYWLVRLARTGRVSAPRVDDRRVLDSLTARGLTVRDPNGTHRLTGRGRALVASARKAAR